MPGRACGGPLGSNASGYSGGSPSTVEGQACLCAEEQIKRRWPWLRSPLLSIFADNLRGQVAESALAGGEQAAAWGLRRARYPPSLACKEPAGGWCCLVEGLAPLGWSTCRNPRKTHHLCPFTTAGGVPPGL